MPVPKEIERLLSRYSEQSEAYESGQYKESELRAEFIDPFFKALGWDMDNENGYAEAYKEVVHEDAIRIGSANKAPDLCFRIGGVRKFFVECKKPSVNVKDDPSSAYQLRRYGWSAKLPLCILTNFKEIAVYDCNIKPGKNDSASVGRVTYLTIEQYEEKWDEIASVFAREAILKGSFDKFAEGTRKKRGTASVDDAFLEEIERWRELLAKNIAVRNADLSQRELNFAVQRIIDRIIFLRICEDRGIEPYGRLMALRNGERTYPRLREYFHRADERYNSGLFHFRREKDRLEEPDELTLKLDIDDKVLKEIIGNLYYPESPYEFSVLSADILGQVYERFLGKVIRLTAGHQAKIEDKPEVRKAGGVYYTPTFIVEYIVKNTVGKLLEGKTPKQAAKLRLLDPACGSGSFLINAYQHLLDWHRDWYLKNGPERHTKLLYRAGTEWRLATEEKKRILLNNIYGVDIDPQAVEVTKLSLLLKVLEGESQETINKQLKLFNQRALPDLGNNIKCGNSLIGPDVFRNQQQSLLSELSGEDHYRINVFDWSDGFPEILKNGGFDAVIGNPPYIRIQAMKEWAPVEVELYKKHYRSAAAGNYDIYVVFVEKAINLLTKSGLMGFILPHKFFNAKYGEALRKVISEGKHLSHVVHFADQQVFTGATTYTCLMFLNKAGVDDCRVVKVTDLDAWRTVGRGDQGRIRSITITAGEWNFTAGAGADTFEALNKWPAKLADIAEHMAQGIRTSANEVYVLDLVRESGKNITAHSQILDQDVRLERKAVSMFLQGREIKPYRVAPSGKVVIVPYTIQKGRAVLIPEEDMQRQLPLLHAYLSKNKDYLSAREKGRMNGPYWYAYIYPKNIDIMQNPKILVPDIADRASFALDEDGDYTFTSGYGITLRPDVKESQKYTLALLNSSLLDFYLKRISTIMRGGFFRYFNQFIGRLPIRRINFSDSKDKGRHDDIVHLADEMLTLHRNLATIKTPDEKSRLERRIVANGAQIDSLVYELYGLTDEEIKIVEGSV